MERSRRTRCLSLRVMGNDMSNEDGDRQEHTPQDDQRSRHYREKTWKRGDPDDGYVKEFESVAFRRNTAFRVPSTVEKARNIVARYRVEQ